MSSRVTYILELVAFFCVYLCDALSKTVLRREEATVCEETEKCSSLQKESVCHKDCSCVEKEESMEDD